VAPPLSPAASDPEERAVESQARAAGVRGCCRWCGQPLPLLARLKGDRFCSGLHERQYHRRQAELLLERVKKYRRQGGGSKLRSESTKITVRPPRQARAAEAQPSGSEGLRRSSLPEAWRETLLPLAAGGAARQPQTGIKPGKPGSVLPIGVLPSPGPSSCAEASWTEPEGRVSLPHPCRAVRVVMGELEHPRVELEQAERYHANRAAMNMPRRPEIWWKVVLWTPPRLPGVVTQARTGSLAFTLSIRPEAPRISGPPGGTARSLLPPGAGWQAHGLALGSCFPSLEVGHLHAFVHRPGREVLRWATQQWTTERTGASRFGLSQQWKAAQGSTQPAPNLGPRRVPPLTVRGEVAGLPVRLREWQTLPAGAIAPERGAADSRWATGFDAAPQNGWANSCHFPGASAFAPAVRRVSLAGPMDLRSARIGQALTILRPPAAGSVKADYRFPGSHPSAPVPSPVPVSGSVTGLPCQRAGSPWQVLPKCVVPQKRLATPVGTEAGSVPGSGVGWTGWAVPYVFAMTLPLRTRISGARFGKRICVAPALPAPSETVAPPVVGLSWAAGATAGVETVRASMRLQSFRPFLTALRARSLDLLPALIRVGGPAASASTRDRGWHEEPGGVPAELRVRFCAREPGMFWPGSSFLLHWLPQPAGLGIPPGSAPRSGADLPWQETRQRGSGEDAAQMPRLTGLRTSWKGGAPPARSDWTLARLRFAPAQGTAWRPEIRPGGDTASEIAGPEMRFGSMERSQGPPEWKPEKPGATEARLPSPVMSTSSMAGRPEWWEEVASAPPEFCAGPEPIVLRPVSWRRSLAGIPGTSRAASGEAVLRRQRLRLPHLYCRFPAAGVIQGKSVSRRPLGFRPGNEG